MDENPAPVAPTILKDTQASQADLSISKDPKAPSVSATADPQEAPKDNKSVNGKKKKWTVIAAIALVFIGILALLFLIFRDKIKGLPFYQKLISSVQVGNSSNTSYEIDINFAKYNITNTTVKPSLPDYSIAISDLYNIENFETKNGVAFSDSQKAALTDTNFFMTQNLDKFWKEDLEKAVSRNDDWTSIYGDIGGGSILERAPENSVFISSDFLLHVYHKLLEKEVEYIEDKSFYPILRELTNTVFEKAVMNYAKETDLDNKASYERIIAFFAVPKTILDSASGEIESMSATDQKLDTNENILKNMEDLKNEIPDNSYQKAKAELTLILKADSVNPSPLFDEFLSKTGIQSPQDYTQYAPRSHYNKNSILRSYFRAMMWYGRNGFPINSPELTRDAINISLLMKNTNQISNWEKIYVPTTFLVGKSDDLGIFEYKEDIEKIGKRAVTAEMVSQVQEDMKDYQSSQIQSSVFVGAGVFGNTEEEEQDKVKGFRLMGQRFTPDAFIFSSLTQGDEKADPATGQKLPSSTTGIMVMSVLGNKTADQFVQNWITSNAPDSDKVLNNNLSALKEKFAKISTDTWTQNVYWAWLYTIKSLYTGDIAKTGYPMFVKNDDWNTKNLYTSLGSWTELKHDTLLYSKQSYSEYGGGGDGTPPPVPKGYVEPNIAFFDRLIALAEMTRDGFKSRDLIDSHVASRTDRLVESLIFFRDIAVKELQNEKISDEDFEELRNEAKSLDYILSPLFADETREKDARSALVADVHTDAKRNEILYEADGIPNYIYVAVKDQNGTRLTKGLVYSYYEFTNPLGQRLTDQDWWTLNYTQDKTGLPSVPNWSESLYK